MIYSTERKRNVQDSWSSSYSSCELYFSLLWPPFLLTLCLRGCFRRSTLRYKHGPGYSTDVVPAEPRDLQILKYCSISSSSCFSSSPRNLLGISVLKILNVHNDFEVPAGVAPAAGRHFDSSRDNRNRTANKLSDRFICAGKYFARDEI